MIGCGAEGLSATTQITAPQQPHKHTLPEERRPAKSVTLKSLVTTLLYTNLFGLFWILLSDNIVLLKILSPSVEATQNYDQFFGHISE